MSDLISRQDAIKAVANQWLFEALVESPYVTENDLGEYIRLARELLKDIPSAEPKTGKWVLKEHLWECDQCGCRINRANPLKGNIWNYNFCPNCGARMYKGGEDE